MEKLRGKKLNVPSIGRQKGIISQHLSFSAKRSTKRTPKATKVATGMGLPPNNSEVNQGEIRKKTTVTNPIQSFWTVKFCTLPRYLRLTSPQEATVGQNISGTRAGLCIVRIMKVAVLCNFPLHTLEDGPQKFPIGLHATSWLIDLPLALRENPALVDYPFCRPQFVSKKGTFHLIQTEKQGRSSSFYRKDLWRLSQALRSIRPHLVHGWGTEDVYGLATAFSGFPNILSMQGIISHYCVCTPQHPRNYLQAILEIICLRKAQMVTVESLWGKRLVQRIRGRRKPVELVEYATQKSFFSVEWQPDPREPFAIFIGTIHPRKGIQDLVEAFSQREAIGMRLKIIGDGLPRLTKRLQSMGRGNIEWLGRRSPDEVRKILAKAWCLVLPTRADTSPNVVKEARVIGLPVITTSEGGQSSYVRDGEDGLVIPCGNPTRLREAVEKLLTNFPMAANMGNLGKQRYRNCFLADTMAARFSQVYRKVLPVVMTPNLQEDP